MYQSKNAPNGQISCIAKIEGDAVTFIPFDPANTDYQAYLKWVEAGNTPLPAENT